MISINQAVGLLKYAFACLCFAFFWLPGNAPSLSATLRKHKINCFNDAVSLNDMAFRGFIDKQFHRNLNLSTLEN